MMTQGCYLAVQDEPEDLMHIDPALLTGLLARTELFGAFSKAEVAIFVEHLQVEAVTAGTRVVSDGDVDDAWYIVLQGEVAVTKDGPNGEHEFAVLSRGESFGEMALIDQAPRSADVTAVNDAILAQLSREAFLGIATTGHPAATKLLWSLAQVLCKRQRQLTGLLLDLFELPDHDRELELWAIALLLRTRLAGEFSGADSPGADARAES